MQERLLARGSDAWNVIQDTLQPRLAATCPVSSDRKAVRFVTQTLNVVQQRISRLQQDGRPIRQEDALSACVALRPLGDTSDRKVFDVPTAWFGTLDFGNSSTIGWMILRTALCAASS